MEKLNREICKMLKRQLKKEGISYKMLAEKMNISEVSVKRMMNLHQSISMERCIDICEIINVPLSKVISSAEKSLLVTPYYTVQQDELFYKRPELYSIFSKVLYENFAAEQLIQLYELEETSLYLYLRELEKVDLIKISTGLNFKLMVPQHIVFRESALCASYFKNQTIDGLKHELQEIAENDKSKFFLTSRLRLTEEEFSRYNKQIEEALQSATLLSQSRSYDDGETYEYTIVGMGARWFYEPTLKTPTNYIYQR
ncbi:helix-turn-helix domain-containing protein [Vibrio sp. SCSIO 43137]|uniref:helix-turn-helix domain-containing protein n=1 Tax=Vibrio sp. SCSIO 43137 TaxID=3021011 RepID=UPI0023071986|nr:helix-turn-helix transcriptional regulator [Vibrio sp. SCSIO 43137]WCE31486.1 helix-turn-helix transcriptional regulator [Vibrio sp. SCSIO 43137]